MPPEYLLHADNAKAKIDAYFGAYPSGLVRQLGDEEREHLKKTGRAAADRAGQERKRLQAAARYGPRDSGRARQAMTLAGYSIAAGRALTPRMRDVVSAAARGASIGQTATEPRRRRGNRSHDPRRGARASRRSLDRRRGRRGVPARRVLVIAALYVERDGVYAGLDDVDVWDEQRDARLYAGPWPVVAHPPCERWCRFAKQIEKVHGYRVGDDGGCFEAALAAVRTFGGVLEHPAGSLAWRRYGLPEPRSSFGWTTSLLDDGATCYVEQGRYGHPMRKATWLYVYGVEAPGPALGQA